ncbi:hypothetical protein MOQ_006209 [Trypanosoma cruzi marinkellei]|uniref:Uncharacterized protein n=1 Tax=Trypanosoma cruzi marinkellei TaxID=85056 RepID=K2MSE8_TRYCR|nr:hypothetical protein MOQ_006209 [Trypanosoma cruzi marinkellei]
MGEGDHDGDHFIDLFLDDFCCLVSRFLRMSCRTRVSLVPAPPPASPSSSSPSFIKPVTAATHVEEQLDAAESMLRLMNEAKPRVKTCEKRTDFPTESAVFLLRLRSLLERHLKQDQQSYVLSSTSKTTCSTRGESLSGGESRFSHACSDASCRRVRKHVHRFPNTVDGDIMDTSTLNRRIATEDAECQTEFSDMLSMGHEPISLGQGAAVHLRRSVSSLSNAHGRLALLLQQHTLSRILTLDYALAEANNNPTKMQEYDLRIQTRYVEGIRRVLEREQDRLNKECSNWSGIKEYEELHYREIVQVLERLEMALASVDCRALVVEEVDEGTKGCDVHDKPVSIGESSETDLVGLFGKSGAGFVSKLVVYCLQCFSSALTNASSSSLRWSYLEKVLFLTDSESPVPTVPMEMSRTPSRGSADMDVDKTPTQERSESVRACDVDELPKRRSTDAPWQEGEHQLQRLMQKFRPCREYEEVRQLEIPI